MTLNIDAEKAIGKAKEFLKEHHDSFDLVSATLVNNEWVIVCDIGFLSSNIKEVKIDPDSGKILEYVNVQTNQ